MQKQFQFKQLSHKLLNIFEKGCYYFLMFTGSSPLKIEKLASYDEYGQPSVVQIIWGKCDIVKLVVDRSQTTVRQDQSPDNGNAHEDIADGILLVGPTSGVAIGDKITVSGVALKVNKMNRRFDVGGILDHLQIEGSIWV